MGETRSALGSGMIRHDHVLPGGDECEKETSSAPGSRMIRHDHVLSEGDKWEKHDQHLAPG